MNGVILCMERKKTLAPVNEVTPDSMLRFSGLTSADFSMKSILSASVNKCYALTDFLSESFSAFFESAGEYNPPETVVLDKKLCEKLVELSDDEGVIVCDASRLVFASMGKVTEEMKSCGMKNAALCVKSEIPDSDGLCCEEGRLVTADAASCPENSSVMFAGAAVLSRDILCQMMSKKIHTLSDIVNNAVRLDDIAVSFVKGSFSELDSAEEYRTAALGLLEAGFVAASAQEIYEGIYSRTAFSHSGLTLIKPVYVGNNVHIGKGSVLENCIIEDNACIGERCELRNCIIGESAVLSNGVSADGCIICPCAEVEAAAQLCENSVVGENAVLGSGSRLLRNVYISAGRKTESGIMISSNIRSSAGDNAGFDEECSIGLSTKRASPSECTEIAMAAASAFEKGSYAVCGYSGSDGASAFLFAFESGLSAAGINVISAGRASVQEIMFLVNRLDAAFGCCINTEYSERIRLMEKGGLPLDLTKQASIERSMILRRYRRLPVSEYGERHSFEAAKTLYRIFLSQNLPESFRGVNAQLRGTSSAASSFVSDLLRRRNDIDGEKIIFNLSNDGGSLTAYTDETGFVNHEKLVLAAMKSAFEKDIPVSVPFAFPLAADKIAEVMGGKLYRYYQTSFSNRDLSARETASRPDNFFVRDGIVLMCVICAYLSDKGLTLGQAISDIPEFYTSQRFAAVNLPADRLFGIFGCKSEGGNGIITESESVRSMIRPLKHRRGIMVFTESMKAEAAAEMCDDILLKIKKNAENT